jgi:hypothetical protein
MKQLATATDDLPYTPNNDKIYSGILLELDDELIIISLPDVQDRYWSAQITGACRKGVKLASNLSRRIVQN